MSKSDKKKYNKLSCGHINIKSEYTIFSFSSKAKAIRENKNTLFFEYYEYFSPTIKNFEGKGLKSVYLNAGSYKPVKNGAKVMIPGVLLYADRCPEFNANEILGVEVEEHGIIGVGYSLMSSEEAKKVREGALVEILHLEGDELDSEAFL